MIEGIFFGLPAGVAAYVCLASIKPIPGNVLSSLVYVLFADVWFAILYFALKGIVLYSVVDVEQEGVSQDFFLLGWRVQSRRKQFSGPHFTDFQDYRAGIPISRNRTRCVFVGPGCEISFCLLKEKADEVRKIAELHNKA